ncbi:MAG: leucyl/phenylalanyl-tRNA--protein transferase [Abitibacteriaceae bacterium]|nr:leucyl/phenylalanyl-tRNA--protein transferase [Abditibacteriaceae bacterium]MBV9864686.1 leucyl/phenylalanyl-tRNA--protein transferase [Abditibacteriaceae bacterium]
MFPPVEAANADGLLAVGGKLSVSTLREAYHNGIFPWPVEDFPLLWFAPPRRAILPFDQFHISRRLQRTLRHANFEMRINTNFEAVIRACAEQRQDAEGTWITDEMLEAYIALHQAGDAHSVETYQNGELVGGLYGVAFGSYFAGESMFYKVSDASKAALVHLVEYLQTKGATWLDAQMMTLLFANFGACEIPRRRFMKMLKIALEQPTKLF